MRLFFVQLLLLFPFMLQGVCFRDSQQCVLSTRAAIHKQHSVFVQLENMCGVQLCSAMQRSSQIDHVGATRPAANASDHFVRRNNSHHTVQ